MAEHIPLNPTPVSQTGIPALPDVPYGTSFEDIPQTSPELMFQYDQRLGQYETLPALGGIELSDNPIVTGMDWREDDRDGRLHRLRAVFHYRGANYGIASTDVDDREFTYVTRFGERGDEGRMLYMLDAGDREVSMHDPSDRMEGAPSALLTLHRTDEGRLLLINEGVWPVQVGLGHQEAAPSAERSGFFLKNIYHGVKRALGLQGSGPRDHRDWDSRLSRDMAWKPESYVPAQWARWKRTQSVVPVG
jgi:hypothetical protein